jgi:EmrB/QacA subfamily drug resistance transporter
MEVNGSVSAPAPPVAKQQPIHIIFVSLMLVLLLAALDQTIVSTALPTIVGDLGGIQHLSWVVTAYLLASTVVMPLYGKLGDLYGRKGVLQAAIVIFLIGSALCGISQNMTELIAFRAVQGIGGGGLTVCVIAVIGDLIAPRERGRYQGYTIGVFAAATVIGPLLGGVFVDRLSWRWIFYINLPLGAIVMFVIGAVFHSRGTRVTHEIDYLGAAVLAGALASLVLFTSLGGTTYPWGSPEMIALIAIAAVLIAVFVLVEHRAKEPILPLELFRNRTFVVMSGVGWIVGLALFGAVTFMPLYLQVVKGRSAMGSGLLLTPMMAGVLTVSIVVGHLTARFGRYRPFPIAGTAVLSIGLLLLSFLRADSPIWAAPAAMIVVGLGVAGVMQIITLAVQNSVDHRLLGVATSGATLFRQVGGSVGVALFGAVFANRLAAELSHLLPRGARAPASTNPAAIKHLPAGVHDAYAQAVALALHPVFRIAAAIATGAFLLSWLIKDVPLRRTAAAGGAGEGFAAPPSGDPPGELEPGLRDQADATRPGPRAGARPAAGKRRSRPRAASPRSR